MSVALGSRETIRITGDCTLLGRRDRPAPLPVA
jgi:hypothetical protein